MLLTQQKFQFIDISVLSTFIFGHLSVLILKGISRYLDICRLDSGTTNYHKLNESFVH